MFHHVAAHLLQDLRTDFHLSFNFPLMSLVSLKLFLSYPALFLFELDVLLGNLLAESPILLLFREFVLMLQLDLSVQH